MSIVSEFFNRLGPGGRAINAVAAGFKPVVKMEAKAAVAAAIDRAFTDRAQITAAQLKAIINKEIDAI